MNARAAHPGHALLIPGPVRLSPAVQAALALPMEPHYGPEWAEAYWRTLAKAGQAARARGPSFLLPGSGTTAVEAALAALLPAGGLALTLCNGRFGERLPDLCQTLGARAERLEAPWGRALDPADLAQRLARAPRPDLVACVHCETSTGVRNPLRELAAACVARETPLFVDAVSSLGGSALEQEAWGIAALGGGSQKCLGAPPGLGLAIFSAEGWRVAESRRERTRGRSWCLDLHRWRSVAEEMRGHHPHLVTMPVNLVRALDASLDELLAEGLPARWARHARCAALLRQGLRSLGWEVVPPEAEASETVTCFRPPQGLSPAHVKAGCLARGFLIAGGLGSLESSTVRVGHMAESAREDLVRGILKVLGEIIS